MTPSTTREVRRMLLSLLLTLVPAVAPPAPGAFTRDVAPILREHCLACHNDKKARGDLSLSSRESLLAGGAHGAAFDAKKPSASLLLRHVEEGKMPPKKPLPAEQVAALRAWVLAGAAWEGRLEPAKPVEVVKPDASSWWSLQPIRRPALPPVRNASRVRTPIDAYILSSLEAKGLTFSADADRRTLLRRVTFDLTGLPPTREESDAFASDARPDAYERVVDRLLASPHYGERWGRHWLDVARFAESHGYEMNTLRPTAWPYRDWAIRAFNRDAGFATFVREQLAGDSGGGDVLSQAATGFLVAGAHDMVGNATVEGMRQQRADDLADIVGVTSSAFLGLTVGCARCHDHKFDPISQRDFYALQATLSGVQHRDRTLTGGASEDADRRARDLRERIAKADARRDKLEPLAGNGSRRPGVVPGRNVERFAAASVLALRFEIDATNDGTEPCIDEIEAFGPDGGANLALAADGVRATASSEYPGSTIHKIAHINDGRLSNSFSWISRERGKGWVQLTWPRAVRLDRVVWGRDRTGAFKDRLATAYSLKASGDGETWVTVASSADRAAPGTAGEQTLDQRTAAEERAGLSRRLAEATASMSVYAGAFEKPAPTRLLKRGDVMQPGDAVAPGVVAAVGPSLTLTDATPEAERRKALAAWVADPRNPLPARVMVNRVWHWHFGRGIVATPGDFGANGAKPSHPELLDYLASEFLASGGSFKALHRSIVLSTAYRQASTFSERSAAVDAGNVLLWRRSPRRLEAEAVRDALLATTGELDTRMGGPGYHLWDYSGYVIVFSPKKTLGPAEFRRMVYQFKPRLQQDPTFGVFDCPDGTAVVPKRTTSTTALQALNLLNDPFMLARAEAFARRVRADAGDDVSRQVKAAFGLAFGREPTAAERATAEAVVREHGAAMLCRALLNANEFVFVD